MSKQYVLQQMLFSILADGVHELIFRKANGDHRMMRATRDNIIIEVATRGIEAFEPQTATEKKERKESNVLNVVVFDIEASDWRSFRIDRLVSINGTGLGTLACLVGCPVEAFDEGYTIDRYISPGDVTGYRKDDSYEEIQDAIENSVMFKEVANAYGVRTFLLVEDDSEF
ncbi:hypothetical protein OFDDKENP_00227 [Aeromonas phage B614]|nr:hypothetical protein OFDDKENP_00227 [Aeromonas phage B614]UYD58296.1 hypothetical protein JNEOFJEA_00217 [Aeromonas phage UP87]UYD58410.1 hypothetical protein IPAKJDPM_00067 [Aeromonas phage avDM14-QBC]UYD58626.1 hypothetical protein HNNIDBEH_00033 [Aeromonas phage avDM10-HWA]UYD59071.1 hypothetical protein OFOPOMKI_00221 [Aeromonas phage avDM7-IJDJ]UYD59883.1 hypothetical protein LEHPIFIF_00110 [Aeromonas phage avDM9-HANS]